MLTVKCILARFAETLVKTLKKTAIQTFRQPTVVFISEVHYYVVLAHSLILVHPRTAQRLLPEMDNRLQHKRLSGLFKRNRRLWRAIAYNGRSWLNGG